MLDVAHRRRKSALVIINDASRHVLRRQTVISPDDRNHRDSYVRENVRRGPQCRLSAENDDQNSQHDERVRSLQGYEDNGIQACAASSEPPPTAAVTVNYPAHPPPKGSRSPAGR